MDPVVFGGFLPEKLTN